MRWLDFLFPPRVDEIAVRDIPTDAFLALLDPRLVLEARLGAVSLLPYADARVRAAIHEAKYRGNVRAFDLLALALADYLRDADDIRAPVIVPVPLGRERYRERGFNQIEEVARRAGGALGILVDAALLKRTRETVSQVSLPKEKREENMRGAFKAMRSVDASLTYLLIDDVITTGATLRAAASALKEAGVTHLITLALAH